MYLKCNNVTELRKIKIRNIIFIYFLILFHIIVFAYHKQIRITGIYIRQIIDQEIEFYVYVPTIYLITMNLDSI